MFPPTKAFSAVSATLAILLGLFPIAAAARSLQFEDLIQEEQKQEQQRLLQDQKLERFSDPELYSILRSAITSLLQEDFAATEASARTLIDRAPESPQGYHILGLALANLGKVDAAIEALDKAAAIYDINSDPLIVKGDLLLAKGDISAARKAYLAASERDPGDWRAQDSLGGLALREGDADAAIERYERAAENAPKDLFEPRVKLAALYVEVERPDDARRVLQEFTNANPDQPEAFVALGRFEFSDGQNDEATKIFDAAIALEPDKPQLPLFKARAELNANRFDDAERTLQKAIAAFPDDEALQMELGGLYGLTREYVLALAAFEEGARRWPDQQAFRAGASRAAFQAGDYDAALRHAETVAGREDANANDHYWHAVVLERLGREGAAIAAYEKAISLDASNWIAMNNLAVLLTGTDPERAVSLATDAAQLAPDVPAVQDTLGAALFEAGDLDKADKLFNELLTRDPENVVATYRLGLVRRAMGQTDSARELLQRAITLDPDFKYSEEARLALAEL